MGPRFTLKKVRRVARQERQLCDKHHKSAQDAANHVRAFGDVTW
jgi:hypothetical protein